MATDKTLAAVIARLDRIEAALARRVPGVTDPSPDDGGWGGWTFPPWLPRPFPVPEPGDPVPRDISRFTRAQLEVSLETIKAQRIRLDAMENVIRQQLKQTK